MNKKQRVILKFHDDNFIEQLEKLLLLTGKVKVTGLGVFEIRHINARQSYNISNGKSIIIPRHNRIMFKPTKLLKEAIQKHEE